jgi:hypothetical protein
MLILAMTVTSRAADIQAFHKAFGPKSLLRISSPTLSWQIWPGEGCRVTSAVMQLNGKPVAARYNIDRKVLEYRPAAPLMPGPYKVECRVVVDEQLVVNKDWSFEVAGAAQPSLPEPDDHQTLSLNVANELRKNLGLEPMVMDSRLNAASLSHSLYLGANNRSGHFEKEGESMFAGRTPGERQESFGFLGGSWECVSAGISSAEESVRDLFDAPYHRLPFMQPGSIGFGSGFSKRRMTLNFSTSDREGVVVSPAEGQTDIATSWSRLETPNPLRLHEVTGAVGYPVMLSHSGVEKIEVRSATLSAGSQSVKVFLNTPSNDEHLKNALILMADKPLMPMTTYTVNVVYLAEGREVKKTWSFRTGHGAEPPRGQDTATRLNGTGRSTKA